MNAKINHTAQPQTKAIQRFDAAPNSTKAKNASQTRVAKPSSQIIFILRLEEALEALRRRDKSRRRCRRRIYAGSRAHMEMCCTTQSAELEHRDFGFYSVG